MTLSATMVAGSTRDFILSRGTIDLMAFGDWPGDAVVTLWLQPLSVLGGQPAPAAKAYACTVTVNDSTGITANYVTVPAGSGYAGDLAPPGRWNAWFVVTSPSNHGFKAVFDPQTFEVTRGPLPPT